MALDAKVVVAFRGQTTFPARALENALRHRDAGRNLIFVHLLHRHIRKTIDIIADILLVVLRKNRNATQQNAQQTNEFLHNC